MNSLGTNILKYTEFTKKVEDENFEGSDYKLILGMSDILIEVDEAISSDDTLIIDFKSKELKLIEFTLDNGYSGKIELQNIKAKRFSIHGEGKLSIKLRDSNIGSVGLPSSLETLEIINTDVSFVRHAINGDGPKNEIEKLYFFSSDKSHKIGSLTLFNIHINHLLVRSPIKNIYWEKCVLDHVEFREIDLRKSRLTFFSCTMSKFEWLGILWPNRYSNYHKNAGEARAVIGQLIGHAKKMDDEIAGKIFSAADREAHYYYLKKNGVTIWNTGELASLSLSRYTNDFGRSWLLPLILIFISSYFFLRLIMIIQGIHYLPSNGWEIFNPLHESYVYQHGFNKGWAYFFEGLHRVVHGTLLFQFYKAFRYHVT